ncbi:N-6 DNA methylase [soil metagenome]
MDPRRYSIVTGAKAQGATYTPDRLADFVANQILESAILPMSEPIRILDPAVGQGSLLLSLVDQLKTSGRASLEVFGFETNPVALAAAETALKQRFPDVSTRFKTGDFLDFVLDHHTDETRPSTLASLWNRKFHLIIANPPYIRTQVLGAERARRIGRQFGLSGRVDLCYAFLIAIGRVLEADGTAGVIVSNRFLSTRSGETVRQALLDQFQVAHVWDFGDTKLFNAAVLPAVLLLEGKGRSIRRSPRFSSIYATTEPSRSMAADAIEAFHLEGVVETTEGGRYLVQHGRLSRSEGPKAVWRIATRANIAWQETVKSHQWGTFRDLGKIRVGVKTCADRVFIRNDWEELPTTERPELLKPLTNHHIARRFRALHPPKPYQIVYPHSAIDGLRQATDLHHYPRTRAYLEDHRSILERRQYVLDAGRAWYEIWVPQDPTAWDRPKLVFRDISAEPIFWIDRSGSVVNGDCYWLTCDAPGSEPLLWLACAIANSKLIETYYDTMFPNKLYSGRRRFMTQYVEQFPLPDPESKISQKIGSLAEALHDSIEAPTAPALAEELECLVRQAFGL